MSRPPRSFIYVLSMSVCLGCSGAASSKADPAAKAGDAKLAVQTKADAKRDAKTDAKADTKAAAKADAPDAKADTTPTPPVAGDDAPAIAPPAFHATTQGDTLEVEILLDGLSDDDVAALGKLAGADLGERTKLPVAPGDEKLPAAMRATELTVIDASGASTAKVVEVAVSQGPSALHGLLLLDRAAKEDAHALAVVGAAKNAAAKLKPISTAAVGKTDDVRTAAIAAAKASVTEADGAKWASAKVTSLGDIAKPNLGGLYLLAVEIPEGGGVYGLYSNRKDGGVEPLIDASAEGTLRPLGAVDLDGDGTDEILMALDAFEGAYIRLYVWNESTSKYDSITIAGDGA
jgi:hypothetical protein